MPPMGDLANEFSWSRSRDNTFQECRRRYFYHYYGAWGGWDAGAPEDVRRLYILKQLASRQMWAGRVVHDAIEMAFHAFAGGRDLPPEPFIADVVEGTPSSGGRDFRLGPDEGRLALVGGTTGGSTPDGAAFQLGCYALYAAEVLGVPPAKVDLFEANLREPEVTQLTWSDERLEAIKEQLRLSVRSMKAYLVDPAANVATIADFEKAEDPRICRWCNLLPG